MQNTLRIIHIKIGSNWPGSGIEKYFKKEITLRITEKRRIRGIIPTWLNTFTHKFEH